MRLGRYLVVALLALAPVSGAYAVCPSPNVYPFTSNCPLPAAQLNAALSDRTVAGSLPVLNAKQDYGATGDGATDDGPALASALAACDATHPLYLPPGQYKTKQRLTAPAYCKIYGDFSFSYLYTETRSPAILADNADGAFTDAGSTPSGAAVLTLGEAAQLVGVAVFGTDVAGEADTIRVAGPWVRIEQAGIFNGGTANLYCYNASPLGQGLQLINSLVGASAGNGVYNVCSDSVFSGNYIFTSAKDGLIVGASKVQVVNNTIEWNGATSGPGINLLLSNQYSIVVSGNQISDNYGPGVTINNYSGDVSHINVVGNNFYNNGRNNSANGNCHLRVDGTITNVTYSGNTYGAAASPARPAYVWCGGTSPAFDSSARVADTYKAQATGIYENTTIQDVVISAATLSNRVTTNQYNMSLDTTLADVPKLSLYLHVGLTYRCKGHLTGISGASGGAKFSLGGTLTASYLRVTFQNWNNTTINKQQTLGTLGSAVADATAIYTDAYFDGVVTVSASGTLTAQIAQNASNATDTSVYIGSTMECTRIAPV